MKLILCCTLLLLASCSFKKSQLENQVLKGHEELYSEPSEPKTEKLDEDERRIVIASTNDLHGNYNPAPVVFKDDHNKGEQSIKIGGTEVISNYYSILRDTYRNVVLVDSGDIFSRASDINTVKTFYSDNNYDAVTVGLRDFNLKVPAEIGSNADLFQKFAKSSSVPLLLSNLYELKTARVVEWEGTKSHIIKEVDGVKVGVIGLIPDDIVAQTPVNNRVGLFVENMLQSTLRHARLLRSLGADIIVVLTHQGIDCSTELAEQSKLPPTKVNFEPERKVCDLKNALGEYLERLPPELVDVVVGGRNHLKMANFVNGTLVMSGFPDGKSFSYSEFVVNVRTKKVNRNKTVVHQPVFFCDEFFKETKDCYTEDRSVDHKKRVPATFLGKPVMKNTSADVNKSPKADLQMKDIAKSLVNFKADLSYVPETSGETQLFLLTMTGKELAKVLEEDYNHNRKDDWRPSPYLLKNGELTVFIGGLDLELNKTYKILTDLESVQKHKMLVKNVTASESEALMNHSWNSIEEDSVSTAMAARTH